MSEREKKKLRKKRLCPAIHHTGNLGLTKEIFNDGYLDPCKGIQLSMRTRSVYFSAKTLAATRPSTSCVNPVSLVPFARPSRTPKTSVEKVVNRSSFWSASVSSSGIFVIVVDTEMVVNC